MDFIYRGEIYLTHQDSCDYHKELEIQYRKFNESGIIPWRLIPVEQISRSYSNISTLSQVDTLSVDKSILNKQNVVTRSSSFINKTEPEYKSDVNDDIEPIIEDNKKIINKKSYESHDKIIEFDENTSIYKILHPNDDIFISLPDWVKSLHDIITQICYMPIAEDFIQTKTINNNNNCNNLTEDTTPEVQSNSVPPAESSSNSLPVNGNATPGDRGEVNEEEQDFSTRKNVNVQPLRTGNLPGGTKDVNPEEQTSLPPEVQSTSSPLAVEASSNYLPVNGSATPGDRGEGVESSTGPQVETSSGLPVADLWELEGEVNKGGRHGEWNNSGVTSGGKESTTVTSGVVSSGKVDWTKSGVDVNISNDLTSGIFVEERLTIEGVLKKLISNDYKTSTEAFSDLYMVFIYIFRTSSPGTLNWMNAQDVSSKLNELRIKKNLKDSSPNYKSDITIDIINRHNKLSMDDFQREAIGDGQFSSIDNLQRSISITNNFITDDERLEFYDNVILLTHECHLELFTIFEHSAIWKIVGNGEIELDDRATEPNVFRSMIKWVKDRRNNSPLERT